MSLDKAASCGFVGNELSKQITGSIDYSVLDFIGKPFKEKRLAQAIKNMVVLRWSI